MVITPEKTHLTLMELAVACGCRYSTVRQALNALVIQPSHKAGRVSVFAASDLPAIRQQLIEAGLIDAPAVAVG